MTDAKENCTGCNDLAGALRKLSRAADYLVMNYLRDELEDRNLCISDDHWAAIQLLNSVIEDANATLRKNSQTEGTPQETEAR